jgi:hypothetical protein
VLSIPPPGTEDRRALLASFTAADLRRLASEHGLDNDLHQECWGWGASAAGLAPGISSVNSDVCNRATVTPLWYYAGEEVMVRCWRCALTAHLLECELWGN